MKKRLLAMMTLLAATATGAWAQTAYAVLSDDGTTLTFKYDTDMPATNAWDAGDTGEDTPGWYSKREGVQTVVFDASFADARPKSCSAWFYQFTNLTAIEGIGNLNTSEVTTMWKMFYMCSSLTSLDVSNFDVSNVTSMSFMFSECRSLTSLDVSGFNTAKVILMDNMFASCSELISLDVGSFDLSNVEGVECMFWNDSKLKTIYSDTTWPSSIRSVWMFTGCTSLVGAISYDSNKTDVTYANPTNGYFTWKNPPGIAIDEEHFPDENFRRVLQGHLGTGIVPEEEFTSWYGFECPGEGIEDLTGIEYFTELRSLNISNNKIKKLDLSKNTKLYQVVCYANQLEGDQMTAFIDGLVENPKETETWTSFVQLPAGIGGDFKGQLLVVDLTAANEGNEILPEQVEAARAKGWQVYNYNGGNIRVYDGKATGLAIDETNFPDENFRDYLLGTSYGEDGILTDEEIAEVDGMSINNKGIADLTGIEYFTELLTLSCMDNQLTQLDLSKNTKLVILQCGNNQLTQLDLSSTPNLVGLVCAGNQIKGEAMTALVSSLPTPNAAYLEALGLEKGMFVVIDQNNPDEGNELLDTDAAILAEKNWQAYAYTESSYEEYDGINTAITAPVATQSASVPRYNLSGQRVGTDYKGIVIENGRKMVVK